MRLKAALGLLAAMFLFVFLQLGAGGESLVLAKGKTVSRLSTIPEKQREATIKRNTVEGSIKHKRGNRVEVEGRIQFLHADSTGAKDHQAPTRYAVELPGSKAVALKLGAADVNGKDDKTQLSPGQQVSVNGTQAEDGTVTASSVEVLAAAPSNGLATGGGASTQAAVGTQSVRSIAIIQFHFQDQTYGTY